MQLRGYILVMVAASMWGLIGPVAKVAFAAGMPPLEVAFWRITMGWALFAGQAVLTRKIKVRPGDAPMILAFGVVGIAGLFGCLVLAVDYGGAALAAVLLYTAPAWVALMSRMLFGEALTPGKVTAVILTMAGVAAISLGPGLIGGQGSITITPLALFFGLLAGFSYALYYIFGKKYLGSYTTPTLFLYAMPVGALVMTPFFHFASHPPEAWIAVAILALCSTYGSYSLYYAGLKHLEATRAAVVATTEPVVAAILAYFMWNELFGLSGYLGSALILIAVLVTVLEGERLRRQAKRQVTANR